MILRVLIDRIVKVGIRFIGMPMSRSIISSKVILKGKF